MVLALAVPGAREPGVRRPGAFDPGKWAWDKEARGDGSRGCEAGILTRETGVHDPSYGVALPSCT